MPDCGVREHMQDLIPSRVSCVYYNYVMGSMKHILRLVNYYKNKIYC